MNKKRRQFFKNSLSAGLVLSAISLGKNHTAHSHESKNNQAITLLSLTNQINKIVATVPGDTGLKLLHDGDKPWQIAVNSETSLFCGSCFKVYLLTEFLRQMELGKTSLNERLDLNNSIRTLGGTESVFLPTLTGEVTARTALEAMIMHSDNTATDMIFKRLDVTEIRKLIASLGLKQTIIPDSLRIFFAYILGVNPLGFDPGWPKIKQLSDEEKLATRSPINSQQTIMASCDDFVSFYSRALKGEFFQEEKTLIEFKRILSLAEPISITAPEGVPMYMKGGSLDFDSYAVMAGAGGMVVNRDWVYFSFMVNNEGKSDSLFPDTVAKFIPAFQQITELVRDYQLSIES